MTSGSVHAGSSGSANAAWFRTCCQTSGGAYREPNRRSSSASVGIPRTGLRASLEGSPLDVVDERFWGEQLRAAAFRGRPGLRRPGARSRPPRSAPGDLCARRGDRGSRVVAETTPTATAKRGDAEPRRLASERRRAAAPPRASVMRLQRHEPRPALVPVPSAGMDPSRRRRCPRRTSAGSPCWRCARP